MDFLIMVVFAPAAISLTVVAALGQYVHIPRGLMLGFALLVTIVAAIILVGHH